MSDKEKETPKIIQIEKELMCPLGTAVPIMKDGLAGPEIAAWARPSCGKEHCVWWDSDEETCSVVAISRALNDMCTDTFDGEEWKFPEEESDGEDSKE